MSQITNCIFLSCDRCTHNNYYPSINHAVNSGWGIEVRLPDEQPMDLCPECSKKLDKLLNDFLYGDLHQGEYA